MPESEGVPASRPGPSAALAEWAARQWVAAAVGAAALLVAVPTDRLDTPLSGREVPPTTWARPSLIAVLASALIARPRAIAACPRPLARPDL